MFSSPGGQLSSAKVDHLDPADPDHDAPPLQAPRAPPVDQAIRAPQAHLVDHPLLDVWANPAVDLARASWSRGLGCQGQSACGGRGAVEIRHYSRE